MNSVVMELTGWEKEILDEAAAKVEEEMACLTPTPSVLNGRSAAPSTPSAPISAIRPPKP